METDGLANVGNRRQLAGYAGLDVVMDGTRTIALYA